MSTQIPKKHLHDATIFISLPYCGSPTCPSRSVPSIPVHLEQSWCTTCAIFRKCATSSSSLEIIYPSKTIYWLHGTIALAVENR
eukprot:scaffold1684_cov214-Amphora_coffeaeformis.AAC.16